jgi:hypothetical protein
MALAAASSCVIVRRCKSRQTNDGYIFLVFLTSINEHSSFVENACEGINPTLDYGHFLLFLSFI